MISPESGVEIFPLNLFQRSAAALVIVTAEFPLADPFLSKEQRTHVLEI
jgi:hypothetical protein